MSNISLQHVYKSFDKNISVIKDFSLEIFDEEFLVLVGPSGSGKTTTLRMIAGLEEITDGEIWIDGEIQNDRDPSSRHLSFVFQNYALLPNLTTYENIEFGLLNKKFSKLEKVRIVEKIAKKLSLFNKLGSYPSQLSGGQRQRVALARALVDNEKLILFDEPLSNLDAVLRAEMRSEIIKLQHEFVTTGIYVTHDQIEAMAMASRIVLMIDGKIVQVGTPEQMYHNPIHLDVASFIGSPETNILLATHDGKRTAVNNTFIEVNREVLDCMTHHRTHSFYLSIRPQEIKAYLEPDQNRIEGKLILVENFGFNKLLHLEACGQSIRVLVDKELQEAKTYYLDFTGNIFVFDENKHRVRIDHNNSIIFDRDQNNDEMRKVIRELENYGYTVKFSETDAQIRFVNQEHMYVMETGKTQIKLNHLKDIMNYYNYVKQN